MKVHFPLRTLKVHPVGYWEQMTIVESFEVLIQSEPFFEWRFSYGESM